MSDFLTNLVVRSFSPASMVQPIGSGSYFGSELPRDPMEGFVDPFAEPPVVDNAEEQVIPARKEQPTSVSIREDLAPQSPSRLREPALPAEPPDASFTSREPTSPEPLPPAQQVSKPAPAAKPRASQVTEATPAQSRLQRHTATKTDAAIRKSDVPATTTQAAASKINEVKTGTAADVTTSKPADAAAGKAEIVAVTVQRAPIDPQPSFRRLMRRPANAISLSPQTSSSHLERTAVPTRQKAEPPVVERANERVVERASALPPEEKEQIAASFTTLRPKTSTQPLLPIGVKSRPNILSREVHEETTIAMPVEKVINVAIGRIEVRATSTPAPKRERQANGPKVMNLDDYVHQRSRGAQ